MSKLYKNASQSNFYQSQTVPKFRSPNPVGPSLPKYNDWLGSEEGNTLLNALKKENHALKEHNKTIEGYLKNVVKVFESLNFENSNLRKEIEQRTEDLQRVIESTATNQTLNEQDLRHQIQLYEDELGVLNQHISNIKGGDQLQKSILEEKENQLKKSKELIQKLESNLNSMYQKEKDVSNEAQTKDIKIKELTDKYNELNKKQKPLEEKVRQLNQQNDNLIQKVNQLESAKKKLEEDEDTKFKDLYTQNYSQKTDLEHLRHLCNQQELLIKELRSELGSLKQENYPQQIIILKQELNSNQQELILEQKRHSNAQQREQSQNEKLTSIKLQLDGLQTKYNLLLSDYENLKLEYDNDLEKLNQKQKQMIEKQKQVNQQLISDHNLEISRLEFRIKELTLQIELLQKENQQKDKQLLEMKQLLLDLENLRRELIEQKTIIVQRDHKIEILTQQYNEHLENSKKKYQDLDDRYNNLQELFRKEQEKNDTLFKQNEKMQWYKEQFDEMEEKIRNLKLVQENYKIEINTYQSKISRLEIENEEVKQLHNTNEQEIAQIQAYARKLEKQIQEIELLKLENKTLRETNFREAIAFQTTTQTHNRRSTTSKQDEQDSGSKEPTNIQTRGFNVTSNKTLTTQPSHQQLKQQIQKTSNQNSNHLLQIYDVQNDLEYRNYPYRTYYKNK
ncbi:unnamed protein product [Paramecium pentaurelia]|uniref:Uncharacterized protein n=1 Tax=Paramecium pentaurelia TaxID=43138 RepID=A0A8S1WZ41_9CILI|nr:unnamed protein product [Paramecium pentaurelia]